jgi:hypothetical protein
MVPGGREKRGRGSEDTSRTGKGLRPLHTTDGPRRQRKEGEEARTPRAPAKAFVLCTPPMVPGGREKRGRRSEDTSGAEVSSLFTENLTDM